VFEPTVARSRSPGLPASDHTINVICAAYCKRFFLARRGMAEELRTWVGCGTGVRRLEKLILGSVSPDPAVWGAARLQRAISAG